MAKKLKVEMDSGGSRALLRSAEVQSDLQARAHRIAAVAGPGFAAEVTTGRTRALGYVAAVTPEAFAAEARNRALTRALDAGR